MTHGVWGAARRPRVGPDRGLDQRLEGLTRLICGRSGLRFSALPGWGPQPQ